jgi:hypothetical protein
VDQSKIRNICRNTLPNVILAVNEKAVLVGAMNGSLFFIAVTYKGTCKSLSVNIVDGSLVHSETELKDSGMMQRLFTGIVNPFAW